MSLSDAEVVIEMPYTHYKCVYWVESRGKQVLCDKPSSYVMMDNQGERNNGEITGWPYCQEHFEKVLAGFAEHDSDHEFDHYITVRRKVK